METREEFVANGMREVFEYNFSRNDCVFYNFCRKTKGCIIEEAALMLKKYVEIKRMIDSYIQKHKVCCSESIYQMDDPQIEAIDLVDDLCRIVGYYVYPE